MIRRALAIATAERYSSLIVNFGMIAVMSRLLTPEQVGLSVIGALVLTLAEALRDCPSTYLVQERNVAPSDVRTAFTVMFAISVLFATVLTLLAPLLAAMYGNADLELYLWITAVTILGGPFERPIVAQLRRQLRFGAVALITSVTTFTNAAVAILLAWLGFGGLSFAWSCLAATVVCVLLSLRWRGEPGMFRFDLSEWRKAFAYGAYPSAAGLLACVYQMVPVMLLGRLHQLDATGIYSRASMLTRIPDRIIVSGMIPVALPAFSAIAREGQGLSKSYLRALQLLTALHWPAMLFMVIYTETVVRVVLGSAWLEVVPLVRIMAIANMAAILSSLVFPVLVAAGGVRDVLMSSLVRIPICLVIASTAATIGPEALAYSELLTAPFAIAVSFVYLRRHLGFAWRELAGALGGSAVVCCTSMLGTLPFFAYEGFTLSLSWAGAAATLPLAFLGWIAGLLVTKHPLLEVLRDGIGVVQRWWLARSQAIPPLEGESAGVSKTL